MTSEPVSVGCQFGFPFLSMIVVAVMGAAVVTAVFVYFRMWRAKQFPSDFGWSAEQWDGTLRAGSSREPSPGALETYWSRIEP